MALSWVSAQKSVGERLKKDLIVVKNRPAKRTLVIPSPILESVDDPAIVADAARFESFSERDAEAIQAKGVLNEPVGRQADVTSGMWGISASTRIRKRSV